MMAALCMTPLMAENLRDIADNLPVAPRVSGHKLEIPSIPGAQVRFLGADYEQIIRRGGNIVTPLTDTQVKVSFVVSRDGEEVVSRDYDVTVPGMQAAPAEANPAPKVLPALLNWVGGTGSYTLGPVVRLSASSPCAPGLAAELEDFITAVKASQESGSVVQAKVSGEAGLKALKLATAIEKEVRDYNERYGFKFCTPPAVEDC